MKRFIVEGVEREKGRGGEGGGGGIVQNGIDSRIHQSLERQLGNQWKVTDVTQQSVYGVKMGVHIPLESICEIWFIKNYVMF